MSRRPRDANLPEHTSKLEETYEAEGGQVGRRQQQLRVVQRDAHPLETRLEHGTRQFCPLRHDQRFYLQRESEGDDERLLYRLVR